MMTWCRNWNGVSKKNGCRNVSGMEYRKKVNDLGTSKEWQPEKENDKGKNE